MNKGIDGLASIVQYEYDMDLYDDAIFLFCGGIGSICTEKYQNYFKKEA